MSYTGGAPPERDAFFKLAVYKRVGKIAILVYESVTKSAAKWKKWWLKRSTYKYPELHQQLCEWFTEQRSQGENSFVMSVSFLDETKMK